MFGFSTFGVISYHLEVQKVMPSALIPVTYAVSMGAAALAALASGTLYDRVGLRGLLIALPLTAAVPFLSFTTSPALVWAGAVVWGAALGIHESTLRAAVADLVPAATRGTGYGIFTAIYGIAWLAGSTIIGALYSASPTGLVHLHRRHPVGCTDRLHPLAQIRSQPGTGHLAVPGAARKPRRAAAAEGQGRGRKTDPLWCVPMSPSHAGQR